MRRAGNGLVVGLVIGSFGSAAMGQVDFSHDIGSVGAPGSAVNAAPNAGHVFSANGVTNLLAADLAAMGLVPGDNIDALERDAIARAPNGVLAFPFLFSVEPGAVGVAPLDVWAQIPFNAADVYAIPQAVAGHVLAYNQPVLGLETAVLESIDGMMPPGVMNGDVVFFSLQNGSPTLLNNAWSGADILSVVVGSPGTLSRAARARDLGLIPEDEVDGLAMYGRMDANGNIVFDDPLDSVKVYFSVDETSVGEIGTAVRQRSIQSAHHGGDIYTSTLGGTHLLFYRADRQIRLGAGDVLDALKLGSFDQADPFPMYRAGGPDPDDEPEKPMNCPPYRGIGAPIGCIWVEICDTPVAARTNYEVVVKLCKADGTEVEVRMADEVSPMGNSDGDAKANDIAQILGKLEFTKPETGETIKIFNNVAKELPPQNVMGNNIVGEVCGFVSQELIDCGYNLDAICLSYTNWTASIIAKPVMGWFPDTVRQMVVDMDGVAESDGLVRITTRGGYGAGDPEMEFVVPVAAGQEVTGALVPIMFQINDSGGLSYIDDEQRLVIERLGLEPEAGSDGSSGPLISEIGVNGVPSIVTTIEARLARGPRSPCNAADFAEPYGELDFFDISAFLEALGNGEGMADLFYDGEFDFFDISAFLEIYSGGCP
jgi:hypothetical protein